jgi:hypothetical protein
MSERERCDGCGAEREAADVMWTVYGRMDWTCGESTLCPRCDADFAAFMLDDDEARR